MRLGLLINFNVVLIKDGIRRVVNDLPEQRSFRRDVEKRELHR